MMLKLVEIVKNGNSNKDNTNNSNSKPVNLGYCVWQSDTPQRAILRGKNGDKPFQFGVSELFSNNPTKVAQ